MVRKEQLVRIEHQTDHQLATISIHAVQLWPAHHPAVYPNPHTQTSNTCLYSVRRCKLMVKQLSFLQTDIEGTNKQEPKTGYSELHSLCFHLGSSSQLLLILVVPLHFICFAQEGFHYSKQPPPNDTWGIQLYYAGVSQNWESAKWVVSFLLSLEHLPKFGSTILRNSHVD